MAEVQAPPVVDITTPADKDGQVLIPKASSTDGTVAPLQLPTGGEKKVKKIIKRKRRPARPQVDSSTFKSEPPPQTGTIFNIWYNKWSGGDREDKYLSKHAAPSRCSIARDSGYTRADKVTGSYFCLFFARGICPKGHECEYLHRLPGIHDLFNPNVDCFGRDKHSDYRDDMGGVGTFMRQNRTLYVGRIHVTDDIEEIVARHFQEWGEIERTRVLTNRGVAFVTYINEANSQFAKEAMAHQAFDHSEVLNVRWATVDPNPAAQKREALKVEDQAAEAIRRALPASYVAELEGRDPEAAKRRKIEGSFGLNGYEAPDDVWYARETAALEQQANEEDNVRMREIEAPPMIESKIVADNLKDNENDSNGGIISNATLAALESFKPIQQNAISKAKSEGTASLPLVGYDSDDDSS